MKSRRRNKRAGYVSLLAVTFAFGLATLGTALAVSFRAYLNAAVTRERVILDRIALESAVHRELGRLAAGQSHTIAPGPTTAQGRGVSTVVSLPEGKRDLGRDLKSELVRALDAAGLPNGLADPMDEGAVDGLAARSARLGLTAAEEDCLRARFTFGRAPELLEPLAEPGSTATVERAVTPGDQVDIRAALDRPNQAGRVLWIRARFTGEPSSPWLIHDYRLLQVSGPLHCAREAPSS